jgi:hypothetical protein
MMYEQIEARHLVACCTSVYYPSFSYIQGSFLYIPQKKKKGHLCTASILHMFVRVVNNGTLQLTLPRYLLYIYSKNIKGVFCLK